MSKPKPVEDIEIEQKLTKLEKLNNVLLYITVSIIAMLLFIVGIAYTTSDPELFEALRNPIIVLGFTGLCMDVVAFRTDRYLTRVWNNYYYPEKNRA